MPRLSPPGLSTPDRLEQACPICEPVESKGTQSAIPATGQPSENLAHRRTRCCIDERLSPGPALRRLVTLLRKLRNVPRSCHCRSTNIFYVSTFLYIISNILDSLSILFDTKTFCESISPGKDPLQHTGYRRLSVWLVLPAPTRYCYAGGREALHVAHAMPPGAVSHGLVQLYSTLSIRPG